MGGILVLAEQSRIKLSYFFESIKKISINNTKIRLLQREPGVLTENISGCTIMDNKFSV